MKLFSRWLLIVAFVRHGPEIWCQEQSRAHTHSHNRTQSMRRKMNAMDECIFADFSLDRLLVEDYFFVEMAKLKLLPCSAESSTTTTASHQSPNYCCRMIIAWQQPKHLATKAAYSQSIILQYYYIDFVYHIMWWMYPCAICVYKRTSIHSIWIFPHNGLPLQHAYNNIAIPTILTDGISAIE